MEMKKMHVTLMASFFIVALSACAILPQDAKPVGSAAASAPKKVQLLFVQNADRVVIKDKHTITLEGVSPATIFFSDRPDRITGHMLTSHFISRWKKGSDNFAANPPNATISVLSNKKAMRDFVVELRNPRLKGNSLTYDVRLLQGKVLAKSAGPCTLFIDALSEPITPDSFGASGQMYGSGDGGFVSHGDIDDGRDIVPRDDATKYDDIDDGRDILPHDDATQYDDIDDGRDIVPHDDATQYDDIDDGRDIVPHDDATQYDDIDDGRDIVPHGRH
jgi:hypothetical protein